MFSRGEITLVSATVALLLLFGAVCLVDAKGSFGSARSSGGGYFRSSKTGFYSSRTRYYTTGMYWRSGYSYSHYTGPSLRTSAGALPATQLQDVMCKRNVRVDTNVADYISTITLNSTQNCYKELYALPGDPGNVAFDQLMLNRFRFRIDLSTYPTVYLNVYPDKDITVPSVNVSLRARRLQIVDNSGVTLAEQDLSGITWQPCTLLQCQSGLTTSTIGRPSSRFVEGGRVMTVAVTGMWKSSVRITLRWWLSNDFDEDGWYDHVLLLPSMIKWDYVVEVLDYAALQADFPGLPPVARVRLESIVGTPKAGTPGGTLTPIAVSADRLATDYNPIEMNRIEMGTYTDQQNNAAARLSWWSAVDPQQLCFTAGGTTCTNFDTGFVASTFQGPGLCVANDPAPPAYCQNLLLKDQTGYSLVWTFNPMLANGYQARWYMHFGYFDPNEGLQAIPASAPAGKTVLHALLAAVAVALFAVV